MILNIKKSIDNSNIKISNKENIKCIFLLGVAVIAITGVECADLSEKISKKMEQDGLITKKSNLEDAKPSVKDNRNTQKTPSEGMEICVQSNPYPYQYYVHPMLHKGMQPPVGYMGLGQQSALTSGHINYQPPKTTSVTNKNEHKAEVIYRDSLPTISETLPSVAVVNSGLNLTKTQKEMAKRELERARIQEQLRKEYESFQENNMQVVQSANYLKQLEEKQQEKVVYGQNNQSESPKKRPIGSIDIHKKESDGSAISGTHPLMNSTQINAPQIVWSEYTPSNSSISSKKQKTGDVSIIKTENKGLISPKAHNSSLESNSYQGLPPYPYTHQYYQMYSLYGGYGYMPSYPAHLGQYRHLNSIEQPQNQSGQRIPLNPTTPEMSSTIDNKDKKNISPKKPLFTAEESANISQKVSQLMVNKKIKKENIRKAFDKFVSALYPLTIEFMYQHHITYPYEAMKRTTLDEICEKGKDLDFIKEVKYLPKKIKLLEYLKQNLNEKLAEKRQDLDQEAIENHMLLRLTQLFPHLESLDLQGTHVTEEGLLQLQNLRALKYLNTRNSGISLQFQREYISNEDILDLLGGERNSLIKLQEEKNSKFLEDKKNILEENKLISSTVEKFFDDIYSLTIEDMYQQKVIDPNTVIDPNEEIAPTALDKKFSSVLDEKFRLLHKYKDSRRINNCYSEGIHFSDILKQRLSQEASEQQQELDQGKIENNILFHLIKLSPNVKKLSLQGTHVTEEGLLSLIGFTNLSYLDTRNSGVSTEYQTEYNNKESIHDLLKSLGNRKNGHEFNQFIREIYSLTIDHMFQCRLYSFNPTKEPRKQTILEEKFKTIFKYIDLMKTIKINSEGFDFSKILRQEIDLETVQKRDLLDQGKLENNTLLNFSLFASKIEKLNLQGTNITEEGLWHLKNFPNLCYLDIRNTHVRDELRKEYSTREDVLDLFKLLEKGDIKEKVWICKKIISDLNDKHEKTDNPDEKERYRKIVNVLCNAYRHVDKISESTNEDNSDQILRFMISVRNVLSQVLEEKFLNPEIDPYEIYKKYVYVTYEEPLISGYFNL